VEGYLRGTDFLVAGSKPRQVAFAVLQVVHAGNLKSHYAFYISIGMSGKRRGLHRYVLSSYAVCNECIPSLSVDAIVGALRTN